jgi:hypothetical protein
MSHLKDVNETYFKHMREAISISVILLISCIACFIHSLFPFLFKSTASNNIKNILKSVEARNNNE